MPETIDGYVDDRHPDTEVVIPKRDSNYYHETRDGETPICGMCGRYRAVSLETAIGNWTEPCQRGPCVEARKSNDHTRHEPDTVDDCDPSLFFGITWRDETAVERAYWDYYWSRQQIADWVGVSESSVRYFMDEYDIPSRSVSESQVVLNAKNRGESLEDISEKVPDPRLERPGDDSDDDSGVPWGKYQDS